MHLQEIQAIAEQAWNATRGDDPAWSGCARTHHERMTEIARAALEQGVTGEPTPFEAEVLRLNTPREPFETRELLLDNGFETPARSEASEAISDIDLPSGPDVFDVLPTLEEIATPPKPESSEVQDSESVHVQPPEDLEELTVPKLKYYASELEIEIPSKARRDEIIEAIKKHLKENK